MPKRAPAGLFSLAVPVRTDLLRTTSSDRPLAIHGVQHVMHPPTHIAEDEAGPSFLVFIASGIGKSEIERSLSTALHRLSA
jgi:hypothetical protein